MVPAREDLHKTQFRPRLGIPAGFAAAGTITLYEPVRRVS
jgi:hypothetical protein